MNCKTPLFAGWLCLTLWVPAWTGFTQTPSPTASPDRYLLVLDVSAPMRPRAAAVQEAITSLFMGGMRGEIREGDQIGVWTFNDQLHTGEFEMIEWKESERNEIARKVLEFIQTRTYDKQTRFETVRKDLLDVMANSSRITVLLVSDGDEVIQGTPYDLQITRYFQENAAELKDRNLPVITILRAQQGRVVGYKIAQPPRPLEFPPFPPKVETRPEPVTNQPSPAAARDVSAILATPPKGPIVYAEPLIVSGKDRSAKPPPTTLKKTNAPGPRTASTDPTAGELSANGSNQVELPTAPVEVEIDSSNVAVAASTHLPAIPSPTETGDDTTADSGSVRKWIVAGVVLLGVVLGFLLWKRKPRFSGRTSLITQSLEDDRKPRK